MTSIELDFSAASGDDAEALSRDRIPVRSMTEADLPAIIATDSKITGRDRSAYCRDKLAEVLNESGVRVSLVAEIDGQFAGFVMARVDYGDFGRANPVAVIDTIGVLPLFTHRGVGRALISQLMVNLSSLRVERVKTQVSWDELPLASFLHGLGFTPSQRLSFIRRLA
ncbi:GNAT family N-acetyltransferase [Magnetospirillum fulvum]|uniref:Ribosomal protein S18 acetylase RimI n=1 Tax=Magnetospirillum fulvum TaxID=1082 RepID=A0A1H6HHR6_MAGFU|nr:GNAT family N-acetyltransferase [Magnetospirillum fulvum]SEH33815.1 Ribosomal protein S18 acetylase RimI [Magnetospirillum fulvum]